MRPFAGVRGEVLMRTATLERTSAVLADHVTTVVGVDALRGLLGRDGIGVGEALYFPAATFGAVHSFGMRFAFDALYLDRRGRVRRVLQAVKPWRLCPWDLWTVAALEMATGAAADVRRGGRGADGRAADLLSVGVMVASAGYSWRVAGARTGDDGQDVADWRGGGKPACAHHCGRSLVSPHRRVAT